MVDDMKVKVTQEYTAKFYLNSRKKPIVLTGLTKDELDNFSVQAQSKMFIKYGPIILRTDIIDYIVIEK